jgi:hypothetical protein
MDQSPTTPTTPTGRAARRPRIRGLAIGLGLLLAAASAGTVEAGHAEGRLDCGPAVGAWDVGGSGGPGSPVPWSGLFHLEGTTTVFRALSIRGQGFPFSRPSAAKFPGDVITCELWSPGNFGFPGGFWTLTGVLIP